MMQPTTQPKTANPMLKFLYVAFGALVLLLVGFFIYKSTVFHVVKTDPSMSSVGKFSPYIQVYFNKPLKESSIEFTDRQSIVTKTIVAEKTITFNLSPDGLEIGRSYTITLENVMSESGDVITNKKLTFTVKDIAVSDLSKGQQAAIMKIQDSYPYTVTHVPFTNFDELTNSGGLSSDQEQAVKQAIFDYSAQIKTEFTGVVLDTASITPAPLDPNNPMQTITFGITANKIPYNLTVMYDELSTATVLIHDQAGNVVYDNTAGNDNDINSVEE